MKYIALIKYDDVFFNLAAHSKTQEKPQKGRKIN